MFKTLRDAFKVEDLRKRILFTFFMLFAIRSGAAIPIPGIDSRGILEYFNNNSEGLLGMFDAFSGGAFKNMTIFALGIIPYINSSIIMNLLTIAIPALEEMQKDGEDGRKKIAKITRYATIGFAVIQATAISIGFRSYFVDYSFWSVIAAIVTMTAGTAFLMWCGEKITENGVGNGISLIITVNILSGLGSGALTLYELFMSSEVVKAITLLVVFFLMIVFVVLIQLGERRIPVQYAKRVQGRKVYGGQSTHIPMKVNMAGVIPVIFASSLLQFPATITSFITASPTGWWGKTLEVISISNPYGAAIYFVLIIAFAYFYTAITFNPYDVANNMKKNGGFIPGIRPGKPTVEYLSKVLSRLVLIGAVMLGIIALAPVGLTAVTKIQLNFGGTSLIIVAGVALETVKQVQSQLVMRHYKGFLG
ncbi:preprotein translocase subunit [Petrocella atlantisensis]|uniref:Protein translocase subunit SecY n=1 Tax=Petrocella atlantisensis TaxID=2173034 RepID=A0A3P7NZE0_9FIRM|nr:preprotein translocase subunit SecY [Petrocella atlantisensis]MCF8019136.1 preprotein translocase subunit SecY [Vallitaleaceae bacterium]VDN48594.1 preprotein translocase subunit [Petrocella atlantisensis]